MNIKALIFDLDGVICSTDEFHYQAWKHMADKYHIYFDRNINNRLRGVSRMDSLRIILENSHVSYSEFQRQQMCSEKNKLYRRLLATMTADDLSDGVMETLHALRRRGYKLAIGSSSKNAVTILEKMGLADFFDAVADGTQITHSKPDPEVFLLAAEKLGVPPENCVVVEDSTAGIDAASTGGFYSAGIGDASDYGKTLLRLECISDILGFLPERCSNNERRLQISSGFSNT